jgi:hypothetical protein
MVRDIRNHQIKRRWIFCGLRREVFPGAYPAVSRRASQFSSERLMSRIIILSTAILLDPTIARAADMSGCNRVSHLSSARLRWAAVRKSRADSVHEEESCRSYRSNYFEAVMTRHEASVCGGVIGRQGVLEQLDSEIEALNDLIATQCG